MKEEIFCGHALRIFTKDETTPDDILTTSWVVEGTTKREHEQDGSS